MNPSLNQTFWRTVLAEYTLEQKQPCPTPFLCLASPTFRFAYNFPDVSHQILRLARDFLNQPSEHPPEFQVVPVEWDNRPLFLPTEPNSNCTGSSARAIRLCFLNYCIAVSNP